MIRGVHLPFSPNGFLRNQTHKLAYKEAFLLGKTRMKIAPFLTWTHSLKALNSASHMPLDTSVYDLLIHLPYATDWFTTTPHRRYQPLSFLLGKVEAGGKWERERGNRERTCAAHDLEALASVFSGCLSLNREGIVELLDLSGSGTKR